MKTQTEIVIDGYSGGAAFYGIGFQWQERALILPGPHGTAQNLLTKYLLSSGITNITDELVWLDAEGHFCRDENTVSINSSDQVIGKGLQAEENSFSVPGQHQFIASLQESCNRQPYSSATVSLLLFPIFSRGCTPTLQLLSPARSSLKLMSCLRNGPNLDKGGINEVSALARKHTAIEFKFGDYDQLECLENDVIPFVLDSQLAPDNLERFLKMTASRMDSGHCATLSSHEKNNDSPTATPPGPKKKLTIGMATYDDYDGVYFSVQALRMYHPEVIDETEILVVDNNPTGPCSKALKSLEHSVTDYRYFPLEERTGTAVRDRIFREANSDYVMSIDCHVLIVPGAIRKLIDYLDNNDTSVNLFQGPLMSDNLTSMSTHFIPEWNGGMYGRWGTDDRAKEVDATPFEIEMQGLGLFVCARDAWVSFNPLFRGFGGEEGYLHEKVRQHGGRTLCLPFLRWLHRFNRPLGVPYPINWRDRVYNYMLGFRELGLDCEPVQDHFRELLGEKEANRLIEDIENELSSSSNEN